MALVLAENCNISAVKLVVKAMSLASSCMHCNQCHHAALITRSTSYLLDCALTTSRLSIRNQYACDRAVRLLQTEQLNSRNGQQHRNGHGGAR